MAAVPKISFGIIVLNGEPFLRYNLRALYPYAHQIIVAEGASPKATHAATPDGHSLDGTLETLRRFQREEDPEHKLIIVTAEDEGLPNGFWPGEKDQQSQAYARRATGDWLWQIDIDEFYHPSDIERIGAYLAAHPETTCLTFEGVHFWGGFDYTLEGGLFRHRRFQGEPWGRYRRLFRWGPDYRYVTHRPPTVADGNGVDISDRNKRFAGAIWPQQAPKLYHYMMILPEQFKRKGAYYEKQSWAWERDRLRKYSEVLDEINLHNGLQVLDQHNTRNWVRRFAGRHPPQIEQLRADIAAGKLPFKLRHHDDIDRLLADPRYSRAIARAAPVELLRAIGINLSYLFYYDPRTRLGRLIRRHVPGLLRRSHG